MKGTTGVEHEYNFEVRGWVESQYRFEIVNTFHEAKEMADLMRRFQGQDIQIVKQDISGSYGTWEFIKGKLERVV